MSSPLGTLLRRLRGDRPRQEVADAMNLRGVSRLSNWELGLASPDQTMLAALLDAIDAAPEDRRDAWALFHGCEPADLSAVLGLPGHADADADGVA